MRVRPFLSHKREDQSDVSALRGTLKIYGAGGYKDTEDLRLGVDTPAELERAIRELTGGFVWWGTENALRSAWINDLEIPTAVTRATAESTYPIVPLFIGLNPGRDGAAIRAAIGVHTDIFLARNGLVFEPGDDPEAFRRRVARRYVRDAIVGFSSGVLTIAFHAVSEPAGGHDLTFDWRELFDARSRVLAPGALELMIDALANAREASQAITRSPKLRVEPDLPLPLAYLVGYEWRIASRLRLAVNQRTGSAFRWIDADGPVASIPPPSVEEFESRGQITVVVVSCRSGAPGAARRYAASVGARRLVSLHLDGLLDDDQIRGLSRAGADELRAASDRGDEKHLLIVGPATLAMLIGAAANACGPSFVPFWDGTTYVSPMRVG